MKLIIRFICTFFVISFLSITALPVQALKETNENLTQNPQSGSDPLLIGTHLEFEDVHTDGDILLNSVYDTFVLYDISDPTDLKLIKSIYNRFFTKAVVFKNGLIYAVSLYNSRNHLTIWDVSVPSSPKLKSYRMLPQVGNEAIRLELTGSTLVVAQDKKLSLFDVSNPSQAILKHTTDLPAPVEKIRAEGNRLYLALNIEVMKEARIQAYQITTQQTAQLLGSFTINYDFIAGFPSSFTGLVVHDSIVYASRYTIVSAINMANPASATLSDTYEHSEIVSSINIHPDQHALLVSGAEHGTRVLDITDPTNLVHTHTSPRFIGVDSVANNIAWVHYGGWIESVDISDLANPEFKFGTHTLTNVEQIIVNNNIAYIGWGAGGLTGGLLTIDISDPQSPQRLDNYEVAGGISTIRLDGNTIYALSGSQNSMSPQSSFYALNVADPSDIKLLGSRLFNNLFNNFDIYSSYAYLTTHTANPDFQVLSLANPNAMALVHTLTSNDYWEISQIENGRAYITRQSNDLSQSVLVYSLANPTQPTLLGTLPYRAGSTIVGNTMYYAGDYPELLWETPNPRLTNQHTFKIIDISNPAQPVVKSSTAKIQGCDIAVEGTTAYVNSCRGHVLIFDVSNPTKPKRLSTLFLGKYYRDIEVKNDTIYVPLSQGLQIYHFSPSALSSTSVSQVQVDTAVSSSQRTEHGAISPAQADQRVLPNTELTISTRNPDGTVIPSNAILHLYDNSGQSTLPTYVVFTPDAKGQMKVPVSLPMNTTLTISVVDYERGIGTNIVVDTSAYRSYLPVLSR